MTVSLFTPDLRRILDDLARRIGILERRVFAANTGEGSAAEIVFSYAGGLTETVSPPVRVRQGGNLAVLAVSFGTAGSTDTIINVLRNGTVAGTVTVPDGVEIYNGEVPVRFAADSDTLSLEITTAGLGTADMTAAARFT
jgi:hypothetical protein